MKKIIFKIQSEALKEGIEDLSLLNTNEINDLLQNIENLKKFYSEEGKTISIDPLLEESVLKTLHHIMFEVHVIEGELICPESGRRFPIKESMNFLFFSKYKYYI